MLGKLSLKAQLTALVLCAVGGTAFAQADTRPLHIVVGFAAGGSTDVVARLLADKVGATLGRPVIVDNKPGSGGQIAAIQVKNAAPDGSTLMLTIDHTQVIIPLTYKNPGFDPLKDFTPVMGVGQYFNALGASSASGIKSVQQIAPFVKANPDQANFGIPAVGSVPQFAGLVLAKEIGVQLTPIPYKGGAPLVQDLLAGQVPLGIGSLTDMLEYQRSGKLRLLAVSGTQRARSAPDIPTFEELGLKGVDKNPWIAFVGPAGLPAAFVQRFNAAVRAAMAAPEIEARFATLGIEPTPTTPEGLRTWIVDATAHWAPVIKASGYQLQ